MPATSIINMDNVCKLSLLTVDGMLPTTALKCAIVSACRPISETDREEIIDIATALAKLTHELGLEITLFFLISRHFSATPLHSSAKEARDMVLVNLETFGAWTSAQRQPRQIAEAVAVDGKIFTLALKHPNLLMTLKLCMGRLHALFIEQYHAFLARNVKAIVRHCTACTKAGSTCKHESQPFQCRRVRQTLLQAQTCAVCAGETSICPHHTTMLVASAFKLAYMPEQDRTTLATMVHRALFSA